MCLTQLSHLIVTIAHETGVFLPLREPSDPGPGGEVTCLLTLELEILETESSVLHIR